MNTDFIKGVVVPIITVIDKDEKIDEEGMRRQVDFVINGGLQKFLYSSLCLFFLCFFLCSASTERVSFIFLSVALA